MLIPRRCANPAVSQFAMPLPDRYVVIGDVNHAHAIDAYDRRLFEYRRAVSVSTQIGGDVFAIIPTRLRVNYVWVLTDEDAIAQGYEARIELCHAWMDTHGSAWVRRLEVRGISVANFPRMMLTPTCSEWRALIVDYLRVNMGERNDGTN